MRRARPYTYMSPVTCPLPDSLVLSESPSSKETDVNKSRFNEAQIIGVLTPLFGRVRRACSAQAHAECRHPRRLCRCDPLHTWQVLSPAIRSCPVAMALSRAA
jgi:hypothetical protein